MISLAGRDILHSWSKFVLTGIGLGLLIGVTLTMAGVYRGMVDDAKALLNNSGADLWVVQQDTQEPYAESSNISVVTDSQEEVPMKPKQSFSLYEHDWLRILPVAQSLSMVASQEFYSRNAAVLNRLF